MYRLVLALRYLLDFGDHSQGDDIDYIPNDGND
jgi:hypothetical protein